MIVIIPGANDLETKKSSDYVILLLIDILKKMISARDYVKHNAYVTKNRTETKITSQQTFTCSKSTIKSYKKV